MAETNAGAAQGKFLNPACDGWSFGAAVGGVIIGGWLLLSGCSYVPECQTPYHGVASAIEFMFNRYQTLIAGLIALYVGYIAVNAIEAQIRHDDWVREQANRELIRGKLRVFFHSAFLYVLAIKIATKTLNDVALKQPNDAQAQFTVPSYLWNRVPRSMPDVLTDWDFVASLPEKEIDQISELKLKLQTIRTTLDFVDDDCKENKGLINLPRWEMYYKDIETQTEEFLGELRAFQEGSI